MVELPCVKFTDGRGKYAKMWLGSHGYFEVSVSGYGRSIRKKFNRLGAHRPRRQRARQILSGRYALNNLFDMGFGVSGYGGAYPRPWWYELRVFGAAVRE